MHDAALEDLRARLRAFVDAREWDQFHNPKNLAMAVVVEAAELVEEFQWLTFDESDHLTPEKREAVEMEVADVLLLLLRLCDRLGIDPVDAARRKLVRNEAKYPIEKSRGRSTKYDKL
jgi:NTP pyrophosphatase (non-canonical NTP hydrolase)